MLNLIKSGEEPKDNSKSVEDACATEVTSGIEKDVSKRITIAIKGGMSTRFRDFSITPDSDF